MNNHTIILLLAATFCTVIAALLCARLFKQPATSHNRSHQLDGLRGVLACAVIAHHFYYNFTWREGGNWGASQTLIQNLGAVSVSLFFLMSAYLHIGKIRHSPDINWREFFIARIKRIYPLYIAVFLLVVAITLSFRDLTAKNLPDFLQFTGEWLLFQNVGFQGFASHLVIAGVQWTLVYEWAVYTIMPLIHMIYYRKINVQAASWVATGVAVWIISSHASIPPALAKWDSAKITEWLILGNSPLRYYWLFILALPAVLFAKPIQ